MEENRKYNIFIALYIAAFFQDYCISENNGWLDE